jgi:RNA polymerase sigma factor (sigma-70 family)
VHSTGAQSVHDLDSPWPGFLDLLDKDPRSALEGLHTYSWKLFEARPPAILRRLDTADREDRIADLVLGCCQDNFCKLRKYQNIGKPFAAWLSTVLVRQVFDWLRSQRSVEELTDAVGATEDEPPMALSDGIVECLNRCLGRLPDKCQKYLTYAAEGMKPREIAALLRLPKGENKSVSDDLRYCMKKLREDLLKEGVLPDEVAP